MRGRICKACAAGDCPDCVNWILRAPDCEHDCAGQPLQLALPWALDGKGAAGSGRRGPDGVGTPSPTRSRLED